MGAKEDQVLELFNGEVVQFANNQAQMVGKIKVKGIPVKST